MIATLPPSRPSTNQSSHSGRSRSSRLLLHARRERDELLPRPGFGSAVCRTWYVMSKRSSSTQIGRPWSYGTGISRRRKRGISGSRDSTRSRTSSMRKRPSVVEERSPPSRTLIAPTCIGYSSRSMCRKLASSEVSRSYLRHLGRIVRAHARLRSTAAWPASATTVWTISPELVLALDEQLGPPVDSYVNGSQTWLVEVGRRSRSSGGCTRSPGTGRPQPLSHYDVWEAVVDELSRRRRPARAAPRRRDPAAHRASGTGSSASPPYGDDIEPQQLAALADRSCSAAPPDRYRPRRPRGDRRRVGSARTARSRSSRSCSSSSTS